MFTDQETPTDSPTVQIKTEQRAKPGPKISRYQAMEHKKGTSDISQTVITTKCTDQGIQSVRGARNVSDKDEECHAK